jgi:hypothetical protein
MGMREHHRQLVTQIVTSSLKSYRFLLSTHFRYPYAGGKFKHIYTGLLFIMAAYTWYDVPWFAK